MLRIRLQRVGRKNIPTFRVVLTDRRNSTKSGKYLEVLGAYDPRKNGIRQFEGERIKEWIKKGAKPTGTLHNIFIDEKFISGKKINVLPYKKPVKKKDKKEEKPAEPAKTDAKAKEVQVVEEKDDTKAEAPAAVEAK